MLEGKKYILTLGWSNKNNNYRKNCRRNMCNFKNESDNQIENQFTVQ